MRENADRPLEAIETKMRPQASRIMHSGSLYANLRRSEPVVRGGVEPPTFRFSVDLRPSPGLVLLLCWRENPGQPGTSAPQPARACSSRMAIPAATRRTPLWRTRRRRTTRTLPKHQRAEQARPSFTPAQAGPAATHAVPAAHHPAGGSSHPETRSTTTHSNKKCLLSISKPRGLSHGQGHTVPSASSHRLKLKPGHRKSTLAEQRIRRKQVLGGLIHEYQIAA